MVARFAGEVGGPMDMASGTPKSAGPEGDAEELTARERLVAGVILFLIVFVFWMTFASSCVSFYRDDNVIFSGPLLVEAARQVKDGRFPLSTYGVGGGGGTPLLSIMQPGVLNPLALGPALFFESHPETMTNVIGSLHLALFAWGGWFLATALAAPPWAGFVAGLSLGFSGCMAVQIGAWAGIFLPYTFLPWIMGGIIRLSEAKSFKELLVAHMITGWAGLSLFWSGAPTPAFYSVLPILCCFLFLVFERHDRWRLLVTRLVPQALLFLLLIVPLLWQAKSVYDYYGREHSPSKWIELSVPLQAYMGLLVPQTYSVWQHVGTKQLLTNIFLFCGMVPAWFTVVAFIKRPDVFKRLKILCLLAGLALFIPILSPAVFELSDVFASIPVFTMFKWPFRGIPAFHVLSVFLFVATTTMINMPRGKLTGMALVALCFVSGVWSNSYEYSLISKNDQTREVMAEYRALFKKMEGSTPTDNLITSAYLINRFYDDEEMGKRSTIQRLRSAGYLVTVSSKRIGGPFWAKPRLFFCGNLGLQLKVPTVHRYLLAGQAPAYEQLGMHFQGQTSDWEAIKAFVERSMQAPPRSRMEWDNGLGPKDLAELAAKTFVGGIVVEAGLEEPLKYLSHAPQWKLLEARQSASVFIRNPLP